MIIALDEEARLRVFDRDSHLCLRCKDATRQVQWCHILSRRDLKLRWESDNAMTLCAGCHMFWHHEPALAVDWFKTNFREQWDRLMDARLIERRVNVRELYEALK